MNAKYRRFLSAGLCMLLPILLIGAEFVHSTGFFERSVCTGYSSVRDCSNTSYGSAGRDVDNNAFSVGEKLRFSLRYGPIRAGTGIMQVKDIQLVDGKPCYHVLSTTRSNDLFSLFFEVKDKVECFIDVKGIFPRLLKKSIREGSYKAERFVSYDQERHFAITERDTIEVPPFVQDFISSLYFVRTQDLKVGESILVDNYDGQKVYPLKVKVHRKERIRVRAGRFNCLVVKPTGEPSVAFFKKRGRLTLWLTDDHRKIIVLMKLKLWVGSLTAELVSYTV